MGPAGSGAATSGEGKSKGKRTIHLVTNSLFSLHSLVYSERFTELNREEKREEGDRGDQDEMRWNQKRREQASQKSIPYVFSTVWNTQRDPQSYIKKRRGRKEIEVTRRRRGGVKRGERNQASN